MTESYKKPVIGIVMGDAAGIGPEIILKALTKEAISLSWSLLHNSALAN